MLPSLLAFSGAAALIVLLPGPDTLVFVRGLLRGGRRTGCSTAAGILSGLTVWVIAASLGLSALLRASALGYLALRIVGASYLVTLGVRTLRNPGESAGALATGGSGLLGSSGLLGGGYRAGLATDLMNPKVGVFFMTFLPGFIPHGEPVARTSLMLGSLFVLETACYFALLVLLVGRITRALANPVVRRRLDHATGAVLIGFGVRLAVER